MAPRPGSAYTSSMARGAVASLVALALLASRPARSQTPEEAVAEVFATMRRVVVGDPGSPAARGPHEWPPERSLEAGTVNGCVESAKVFFALLRRSHPHVEAAYVDSFNSACENAGHAVVAVRGSGGEPFLVDAAAFERVPGRRPVSEAELDRSIDIRPELRGRILQFAGDSDLLVRKTDGGYRVVRYAYGRVFGDALSSRDFRTLDELNAWLRAYPAAARAARRLSFGELERLGLILAYDGAGFSSFQYRNACGEGASRHVIYGCHKRLPKEDRAEAVEPAARLRFKKTGEALLCRP